VGIDGGSHANTVLTEGKMTASNQKAEDVSSEGNALIFAMRNMIGSYAFIDIVRIEEVDPLSETVTVKRLLHGLTTDNEKIDSQEIYGIPYVRLGRGSSAVVMDPEVGDIGLVAICDRDISNVKMTCTESAPGSKRMHSRADAVYVTGIASLNGKPTQYAHFHNGGIDITSPMNINVNGKNVAVNAAEKVSLNSPVIEVNGQLTQGAGNYGGEAMFTNGATTPEDFMAGDISLKTHRTTSIQRGEDTSGPPTP